MAESAGGSDGDGPNAPEELPQHPLVERLKPDPSQPAKRVIVLTGLPGKSDRPGYQRLYLTTKLDYYAEFLTPDMVHAEAVPADQSPFPGHEATRVSIGRDATIHYIWARSPQPVDEFDLDIRLGAPGAAPATHALPAQMISPANGCTDVCHTQNPAIDTCAGHGTCAVTQCVQRACIFTGFCGRTGGNPFTCANTQCIGATCLTCPAGAINSCNTCPRTCF